VRQILQNLLQSLVEVSAMKRPAKSAPSKARARKKSAEAGVKPAPAKSARSKPENAEETAENEVLRGRPYPIVGVGASAGGFEAFRELLHALPMNTGMAFVLVQHLDPGHESILSKLLSRATAMPVREVQDGMAVEPNHVYVIPPNRLMSIGGGVLRLTARDEPAVKNMPIDQFLRSLAEDQGSRAIGVILSGTASDGTRGLKAIKAEGGITFAQDEQSAKYDGMPRSAVAAGCVDLVLPPAEIATELGRIRHHPYLGLGRRRAEEETPPEDDDLRRIFTLLRNATGVDFTHYKYTTIRRRIARRMVLHKLDKLQQYLRHLRQNRTELEALYEDILIHVTGFFREPETFQTLREEILPLVMNTKPQGEPVRVWVPGCSTGEEAYSIAIVLLEYLGERAASTPIQIFGTDISELAINRARAGTYSDSTLVDVSPDRLRRFFVKTEGGYQITKLVREMCIFARQDLVKDPPFSRLDLISCRNVLIYMGPLLQKKVMGIFHYALKPVGFLMLGKSESVSGFSPLFAAVDRKSKIFAKKAAETRPALDLVAAEPERLAGETPRKKEAPARPDVQREADRLTLSRYAPAGLVVNEGMQILHFRGQCSPYLAPASGEASLHLLKMVRPEFAVELRTAVHKARQSAGPVRHDRIPFKRDGETRWVNIEVIPIPTEAEERFFLVLFEDVPPSETGQGKPKGGKLRPTRTQESEVLQLRRDVQTTKDYLQSIIEEQEATNEELKSANEEVLSSNEELQSTNEELETAKEELQSANEELVTVNEQLQNRNTELAQLSDDLTNLLAGVSIPIVMLDNDRRIRRFTPLAEKLLNLLPTDVGRPINNIRSRVNIQDLEKVIGEVLESMSVHEREVQDDEGRWHLLRIRPYRTVDNRIEGVVIVFIDIDPIKKSQEALREERDFVAAVLDTVPALVMVSDREGRIVGFNRACQEVSGFGLEEVKGRRQWDFLVAPEEAKQARHGWQELILGRPGGPDEFHWIGKSGERRLIAWSNSVLLDEKGAVRYAIRSGIDVTAHRFADESLRASEVALRGSEGRLRELAAGLLDLQEAERRRLARDLHDDVSQRVAAWAIEVAAMANDASLTPEAARHKLKILSGRVGELCADLERIARDLHPATIEKLGLVPALESLVSELDEREGVRVRLSCGELPRGISTEVSLALFRVTQEALRNVTRHSAARSARVHLAATGDHLVLSIADSGRGFDPARLKDIRGLGLTSMEERIRLAGGSIVIDAKPGKGVKIVARVPFSAAAKERPR
jgi:two-component system CheB/CheR fusion protein